MHIRSCFTDFVIALGKLGENVRGMSKCFGLFQSPWPLLCLRQSRPNRATVVR